MAGPPRRPLSLAEVAAGSENERLGVARDSMLRNPRILKAELGKPLRNCYTLPGLDFSYGLYIERTDGGVPEAIGHWNTIKPRTNPTQNMPRDFITMNRGALKAGYTTARQFNLYYKAKDVRRKDDEYSRFKRSPPHVSPDRTYGIPARPSTPLFDLLQHKYRELWMQQQRALTAALRLEKTKSQKDKVRDTRTTLLRKNPVPPKEESFWHLPHLEKLPFASQQDLTRLTTQRHPETILGMHTAASGHSAHPALPTSPTVLVLLLWIYLLVPCTWLC